MSRFKSIVRLATNDDFKQSIHHSLHFTSKYGNPYDLFKDFNTYNWILLSDEYLRDISSSNDRKKLHQFFSELGVSDFLFPINNWTCEQFNSLINIQSISMNKKLFLAIQENWLTISEDKEKEIFLNHLKESVWIPTTHISYSYETQTDQIELTKTRKLDKANNIYIKTKQLERLFGQHVQYLDAEFDCNSSFAKDIGLVEHITLTNLISILLQWCEHSIFYTSIYHMQNIYEYIYRNMNIDELKELINNKRIFFVPISSSSDMTTIVRGRFVHISEVCWHDSSNLFATYSSSFTTNNRFILEPYYTEQKSIFLDTFAIPSNPTIEEYIKLLGRIYK
jgi:hypothetical protein